MRGLLVNENRVEEYAAEKINGRTIKIIFRRGLMALVQSLLFDKSRATGAARIDNL